MNLHLSCEGGGNLPHRLSLIRASAAVVRRTCIDRPDCAASYDRADLIVQTRELCVGSSSIETDNVLRAQSRDLSSLIRNLLLIERIETRLDRRCLVVHLIAQCNHGVGDVSAVGSNLLADVVQTCESLTGLNTLLETCRTAPVLSSCSIPLPGSRNIRTLQTLRDRWSDLPSIQERRRLWQTDPHPIRCDRNSYHCNSFLTSFSGAVILQVEQVHLLAVPPFSTEAISHFLSPARSGSLLELYWSWFQLEIVRFSCPST